MIRKSTPSGLTLEGSCSNKKLERDVDRTLTYPALAPTLPCQRENIASRRPYLCLAPRYFGSRVTGGRLNAILKSPPTYYYLCGRCFLSAFSSGCCGRSTPTRY